MNQKFKYFFIGFACLLFVIVGFYFWASSPNISANNYNNTGQYDYSSSISNDSMISIITYNIGYLSGMTNNLPIERPKSLFDQNLNKVIYELKKTDADIVAFQEIDYDSKRSYYVNQQNELGKLGYSYYGQNINWDKKYVPFPYYPFSLHFGKIVSGQSVLSKYPIKDQERIALQRNSENPFYYDSFYIDRLAQVCKIAIKDKTLVLINVHLEAYDQATRKKQMKQVKNLYIKYYKDFPTILLGDFNSDIHFEDAAIDLIMELPDTGCAAFDTSIAQNTFSSDSPSVRLDYIFYNKEFISEVEAKILTQFDLASDHLPLLMKFKLKDQLYANIRRQPTS
ncbi:endonuclease/exonuclease/phosphatase family protein [Lutimonas sp.]|jgi:endonuclease/exonuclease/phosphatase family metal-dependent hydrolase|uniref:endonuclease/exonuclease/phosphatase family protein n=1 Tax=Lutimonas sp. TaxID=1872403 RepID=UPI003C78D992